MVEAAQIREVYREDLRVKSNVKKSAAHKKGGSATQKLGNRRMSWQEIASKHGDIQSWCLEDFLDFKTFTEMPGDLKVEYVNKLCDKYDIEMKYISQYLFNKGGDGLRAYLRKEKTGDCTFWNGAVAHAKTLYDLCNTHARGSRTNSGLLQFQNDIEEWRRREKMAAQIDSVMEEERMNDIPAFIEYQQFKKLNPDDALTFLNDIINYYQIGYSTVAKVLFQVKESSLLSILKRMGIEDLIIKRDKVFSSSPAYKEGKARFAKDVELWRGDNGVMFKKLDEESMEERKAQENAAEERARRKHEQIREAVDFGIEEKTMNDIFNDLLETKEEPAEAAVVEPVVEEVATEPIAEEAKVKETDISPDPREYFDASFTASYVRRGIDIDQIHVINELFANQLVRVEFKVTVLGR